MADQAAQVTPGTEIVQRSTVVSLNDKLRYAESLAQSGLLPAQYRKQPANVLYATEYGEMLGLAPLAAITGLHIIEGKPTASSGMVSALVRKAGHRLRVTFDRKTMTAVATIHRADDPDFEYRAEWNMERAKKAELTGKKVWKQYPEAMLKARAITEVARDACEEALNGVHYTPEELGVEVDEDGAPISVTAVRVDEPQERPDWEALIKQREGNYNALVDLYRRAEAEEPGNQDLLLRIKNLGGKAKAAQEAAQKPAEEKPEPVAVAEPDVVDAEIVEEPVPVEAKASASKPANTGGLMTRGQFAQLKDLYTRQLSIAVPQTQFKLAEKLLGLPEGSVKDPRQLTHEQAKALISELRNIVGEDSDAVIVEILQRTDEPVSA
jgi:hypothetical protein